MAARPRAIGARVVAVGWVGGLGGAAAVGAAQGGAKEGFEAGEVCWELLGWVVGWKQWEFFFGGGGRLTASDDADVGFNDGPDGQVAAVPEPVAGFSV